MYVRVRSDCLEQAALDAQPRKQRKPKDKKDKKAKRGDGDQGADTDARKRAKAGDVRTVEAKLSDAAALKAQQRITSSQAVSSLFVKK